MLMAALLSLLKVLAFLGGLLFVYMGLFLREDEEGKIQNSLEELWIKIDDRQRQSVTRNAVFMSEAARIASIALDKIFGTRLLSLRALIVSMNYSIASWAFWSGVWVFGPVFVLLGILPSLSKKRWLLILCSLPVLAVTFLAILAKLAHLEAETDFAPLMLGFTANALSSFLFIALNRAALKWAANETNALRIASVLLLNLLLVLLLIGPALLDWHDQWKYPSTLWFLAAVAAANFVTCAVGLLGVLLMAGLLAHRLMWPVLSRPVYSVARRGLIKQSKWLLSSGAALMGIAFPNAHWTDKLKELLP